MPKLFNTQTGLLEDVESPEDAFLAGTHGLKESDTANLVSPDGEEVFKIPAKDVAPRLQAGYRFEQDDEALERKFRNDPSNKGVIGAGKKFFKELADEALTFGASEAFLDAYQDPKSPEAVKRRVEEESHPIANIAGGLTGGALSLLYGGPIWKATGWAGTRAAEGALKIASLAGTSKAAQFTGKALAKAAQFGTEGALGVAPRSIAEGVGEIARAQSKLTEKELGDSETVAEALMGVGEDLLQGAVAGAALGAGGKVIGSAVGKAAQYAGKIATKDNLNRWGNSFYLKGKGFTTMTERGKVQRAAQISKLGDIEDAVELFDRFKLENTGLFAEGAVKNVAKADKAKNLLGRTLGRIYKIADKEFGDAISIGKFVRDVDQELLNLEQRGAKAGPDYAALKDVQNVAFNYIRSATRTPNMKEAAIREMMDQAPINFTKARELKQSMSELGKQQLKYEQNAAGHILGKRLWQNNIEASLEQAAAQSKVGAKLLPLLKQTNSQYGFFKNLLGRTADDNMFQKIASRLEGNNFLSLRDTIVGGAGAVAGGVPGTLASLAASQAMRKYGPQMSARVLYGMAKQIDGVQGRLYGSVDKALGLASKVKARPTTKAIIPLSTNMLQRYTGEPNKLKAYRQVQSDLSRFAADPQIAGEAVEHLTEPIIDSAPEVAAHVGAKVTGGVNYLLEQMPKGRSVPNPLDPNVYQPTDRELSQFERKMAVVMDPLSVLDELDMGIVTRDQMQALKQVYPKLYDVAQRRITAQLSSLSGRIPYEKRVKLSQLLEMPIRSREPKRLQQLQANFDEKPVPKAPVGRNRMKFDEGAQTDIDRVLYH